MYEIARGIAAATGSVSEEQTGQEACAISEGSLPRAVAYCSRIPIRFASPRISPIVAFSNVSRATELASLRLLARYRVIACPLIGTAPRRRVWASWKIEEYGRSP